MTYILKNIIKGYTLQDGIIANAINGVIYVENNKTHIVNNKMHFIFTADGCYAINNKTLKTVYIGDDGVSIAVNFEAVNILNSELWTAMTSDSDIDLQNYILNQKYIPSQEQSVLYFVKEAIKTTARDTDVQKLKLSGLYDIWQPGSYSVGDIRNYAGQTWECWTAHDNAIYPDITPDNSQTWANFWRPLHGTSPETARPWTKPVAGTTDMYHVGEYMVYTDGKIYKCLADTVYNPEEYAVAWEIVADIS